MTGASEWLEGGQSSYRPPISIKYLRQVPRHGLDRRKRKSRHHHQLRPQKMRARW